MKEKEKKGIAHRKRRNYLYEIIHKRTNALRIEWMKKKIEKERSTLQIKELRNIAYRKRRDEWVKEREKDRDRESGRQIKKLHRIRLKKKRKKRRKKTYELTFRFILFYMKLFKQFVTFGKD